MVLCTVNFVKSERARGDVDRITVIATSNKFGL